MLTRVAAAFYNFTPILIPQEQTTAQVSVILDATKADTLIAAAGALPQGALDALNLYIIWVVEQTSRQMDFLEDPTDAPGSASWHDIIEKGAQIDRAVPPLPSTTESPPDLVSISQSNTKDSFEIKNYTQKVRLLFVYRIC